MAESEKSGGWAMAGIGLGIGVVLGLCLAPPSQPSQPTNPSLRTLDANLWLQTSGEFRALCLQTYRMAGERLKELRKEPARDGKKDAVVMDLDETVLDNSPFQTSLFRDGTVYSDERWGAWESGHPEEVRAVPGAVEFIAAAEKDGATVHYITNRKEGSRKPTIAALKHLGISIEGIDARLHLMKNKERDKEERRQAVRAKYRMVMLVGDTLSDFSSEFTPAKADAGDPKALQDAINERNAKVEKLRRDRWGAEWIVIPNSSYGEWTRMAGNDPLKVMNPTTLKP